MIAGSRVAVAIVLIAALARPAVAGSSSAERAARRSYQSAEVHFRAGRFTEALAEYQAGYDQTPLPGFLINIAQCQRRLGDLRKARATYQKFVMVAPDSPHVAEVKTLIGELDKLIAELEREKPAEVAGQEAAADAGPVAAVEAPRLVPAPLPGASLPAAPAAAETVVLVAAPRATEESAPPPHKSRWWLWTAIGVAVAGGTATAFLVTRSPGTTTVHDGTLGTLRR